MHLLIDGKNLLYRGIFAQLGPDTQDPFVAISRIIYSYLHKFEATNIHVFWDDDKENLWRRDLHPTYKDSICRDKPHEIGPKLVKYQSICEDVWGNMNIKQYKKDKMEADDLIYAFCNMVNEKSIIVSNDHDMLQIPYKRCHVKVYNPSKKKLFGSVGVDPVLLKCLIGDTSDNIEGYHGIGQVRSESISKDMSKLSKLILKDPDRYILNKKLIDLDMCPFLAENCVYVLEVLSENIKFDKKAIVESLYSKYKIRGIMTEYKSLIAPFKMIGES